MALLSRRSRVAALAFGIHPAGALGGAAALAAGAVVLRDWNAPARLALGAWDVSGSGGAWKLSFEPGKGKNRGGRGRDLPGLSGERPLTRRRYSNGSSVSGLFGSQMFRPLSCASICAVR